MPENELLRHIYSLLSLSGRCGVSSLLWVLYAVLRREPLVKLFKKPSKRFHERIGQKRENRQNEERGERQLRKRKQLFKKDCQHDETNCH